MIYYNYLTFTYELVEKELMLCGWKENIIDIKDSDNLTEKMMVFIILFLIIRFLMPLGYSIAEYLTHNMVMNSVVTLRDEAIHKISNADIISWKEKNKGEIAKCIDSMLSSASSFLRVICNDIVPIIMQTIMIILILYVIKMKE